MYTDQEYSNVGNRNFLNSAFFSSDSLVAKVAFLILVIFLFVIVLKFAIQLMSWSYNTFKSPLLLNGMINAKQPLIIPQDPSLQNSKTILRSVNQHGGIEFSWSVWILINDLTYMSGQYKHIFHKGNSNFVSTSGDANLGLNFPNNGPGLYIAPNSNNLVVIMNTYDTINDEIVVSDIPINKWVNVIIRCKDSTIDVYINGVITKSMELMGVPKQNYGDVYLAMNNGFDGYISNLAYYDRAISASDVREILQAGPNVKMVSTPTGNSATNRNNLDYLSLRWYFYGSQ